MTDIKTIMTDTDFQNRFGMHTPAFQELAANAILFTISKLAGRHVSVSTPALEGSAEKFSTAAVQAALIATQADDIKRLKHENNMLKRENDTLSFCLAREQKVLREAGFVVSDDMTTWKAPKEQEDAHTLRSVIDRAASVWLRADGLGLAWEGDIADAMEAAVNEVKRLRGDVGNLTGSLSTTTAQLTDLQACFNDVVKQRDDYKKRKDDAYTERNRVVAAFAKLAMLMDWPVAVTRTAIEGWSEDWHGCVFIDTPQGQVSWHFHDSHADLFKALPHGPATWDGHTTPVKYERLEALVAFNPPVSLLREAMKLQDFKNLVHRRLDEMGIPKFEGENCRISKRLDTVDSRLMYTAMHTEETLSAVRICYDAMQEADRARGLYPKPDHLTLALAEEAGEVTKAVLDHKQGSVTAPQLKKKLSRP